VLRVTVELVPGGREAARRTIGSMIIGNISDLAEISDYAVRVMEDANPLTGALPRDLRFILREHQRHQSVWALIKKAIVEMEGK
jgi:hypothetical protein